MQGIRNEKLTLTKEVSASEEFVDTLRGYLLDLEKEGYIKEEMKLLRLDFQPGEDTKVRIT
jgi:hypothetical protein